MLILVVMFHYVPLAGWALSLFEYKPGYPLLQNKFIGLKYFQMILTKSTTRRVMRNTLIFSSLDFLTLPLPMLLAVLLNEIRSDRFRKLAQVITTLPHFISWVIVYSLAFALFSSEGLLNQLRAELNLPAQSILTDRNAVYWFQTLIALWKGLGWSAIIYIAAIAGIDQELYEAATVDGAGRFRCALHVTIPGLMPTFIVLMLLRVSNFINSGIDQYYVFQNNIIYNNIEVLDLYVYTVGLKKQDYSYAIAAGIMKSFISIALLFIANTTAKKVRGESII
ncbi:MAG: sugar ABC transporter permease [Clostridia bacterium]|nr:sugar ABC transporter permease [Clostridia bacterium]